MIKKGEKWKLEKQFEEIIEDIFKHYEDYDEEQKGKVKDILQALIDLEKELNNSSSPKYVKWLKNIETAFNNFFGK